MVAISAISPALTQLEGSINQLTFAEQLWLIERIIHRIREASNRTQSIEAQLSKMAADPQIQEELKQIDFEFSATEFDGLENV